MQRWKIDDVQVTKIFEREATRRSVFSDLAGTSTLVSGMHGSGATGGTIVRDGDRFRLRT